MYIRRKVYSDVDYDYGYDYDYEEPRYYSVIMDEDELALFSDLQEYLYSDEGDTGSAVGAALGGLGAAAAMGGAYAGVKSDRFKDYVAGLDKKAAAKAKQKKLDLAKALKDEKENIGKGFKTWGNVSGTEVEEFQKSIHNSYIKGLEHKIKQAEKAGKDTSALKKDLDIVKSNGYRNIQQVGGKDIGTVWAGKESRRIAKAQAAAEKANAEALKKIKDKSTLGRLAEWGRGNKKTAALGAGAAALGAAALGSGIGRSVNRRRD